VLHLSVSAPDLVPRGDRQADARLTGQGRKIAYGTDDGVYFSDFRESGRDPVKMLALLEVTQVDILEEYQLLVVLTGRCSSFSS
jgi:hypothetical protein